MRACVVDKNADAKAKDGEYALKSVNKNDVRVVVASSLLARKSDGREPSGCVARARLRPGASPPDPRPAQLIARRDLRRAIRAIKRINSEVESLRKLSPHQNICSLIDTMQTSDYVHLVLERADSDVCARPPRRRHRARAVLAAPLDPPDDTRAPRRGARARAPGTFWYEGPLPEVEALHVTKQPPARSRTATPTTSRTETSSPRTCRSSGGGTASAA